MNQAEGHYGKWNKTDRGKQIYSRISLICDRQSAWWTTDGGSWHCTGDRDPDYPHGKEMQKGKMIVCGGIANSFKRREAKGKGEKERYSNLNAEFQRIARRDKKAFLSNWCKEIEENNRMGKTRDLFKKIRDIKGIFHAKMGSIKDRNGMDLTEAEDIKKRWQDTQKNCTKKIFTTQIITMVWSLT